MLMDKPHHLCGNAASIWETGWRENTVVRDRIPEKATMFPIFPIWPYRTIQRHTGNFKKIYKLSVCVWVCLFVCEFWTYWDADASKTFTIQNVKYFDMKGEVAPDFPLPNSNNWNLALILMTYGWAISEIKVTFDVFPTFPTWPYRTIQRHTGWYKTSKRYTVVSKAGWVCLSVCEFCPYWDADASKTFTIQNVEYFEMRGRGLRIFRAFPNSNDRNLEIKTTFDINMALSSTSTRQHFSVRFSFFRLSLMALNFYWNGISSKSLKPVLIHTMSPSKTQRNFFHWNVKPVR